MSDGGIEVGRGCGHGVENISVIMIPREGDDRNWALVRHAAKPLLDACTRLISDVAGNDQLVGMLIGLGIGYRHQHYPVL